MTTTLVSKIANAGGVPDPLSVSQIQVTGTGLSAGSESIGFGTTRFRFSAANGNIYVDQAGTYMCSFLGSTFSMKAAGVIGYESAGAGSACDTGLSRISAGVVGVGNGTAADFSGTLKLTNLYRTPLTVATLPATPTRGWTCLVTDASSPTFLATVSAGGTVVTPVFYDGSAWKVG